MSLLNMLLCRLRLSRLFRLIIQFVIEVLVSRDSPDFSNAIDGVPPINTNRLVTTIRVPHGQTVVLGGVYSDINQQGFFSCFWFFTNSHLLVVFLRKKEHVT